MAEAAKSARGSFNEIKAAAHEGGEGVSKSAINAQQALGVLTNSLRGDVENALADIIREMSHTSVVMAALPVAAAVGAIGLLVNIAVEVAAKVKEWREEQEKLSTELTHFGTSVNESFQSLDDKILEASQRADELRNDHLGALRKELELINHASMADLVHELETIAKAADPVFKMLEGHWYTFGIGSEGARHSLDQFKTQYDSLLSQGKDKEASDLLAGTRDSAEKVLAAQKAMANSRQDGGAFGKVVDYSAQYQARAVLQAAGVGYTEKETKAQESLVQALEAQVTAEAKIKEIKNINSGNATKQTGNEASGRQSEAARAAAASALAIAEQTLAADKAMADARLEIQNATIAQRLASDESFAERDLAIKLQANQADAAALDKSGKDYQNQLKASQEKALQLEAQHAAAVSQLRSRASVEQYKKDLTDYEQGEREKIAATDQGSAERLAIIDAAMQEAEGKGLQETDYYRQLGAARVETVKQATTDEAKLRADAGRQEADNTLRMGELSVAAEQEQMQLRNSSRRVTDAQLVAQQLTLAEMEFQIRQQSLRDQAIALDTSAKDYENKLKAIQDKERQLIQQHENETTAIQTQAAIARNQTVLAAYTQFEQSIARGTASVLLGQQSFASMMSSIGSQVASGMLQNALMSMMTLDMTKEKHAAAAAREMFVAGTKFPFPANLVMPELLAAGAFASVMAFNDGTDAVPGSGRGDVVPAMLTPGEGVVPGGVMDGLRNMVRSGNMGGGSTTHINLKYSPQVSAVDSKGVEKMLKTHGKTFATHFHKEVRRQNR
jgi:uncharacterized protein YdcH (DUF465 family)